MEACGHNPPSESAEKQDAAGIRRRLPDLLKRVTRPSLEKLEDFKLHGIVQNQPSVALLELHHERVKQLPQVEANRAGRMRHEHDGERFGRAVQHCFTATASMALGKRCSTTSDKTRVCVS